ncbi:MAG: pitrilysin family protein [Bdellovibrionota bacterium]
MRRCFFIFFLAAYSAFSLSPVAKGALSPVLEKLPNGLQIAWFLNDKLPLVDLVFVVNSGSRDDAAGKSGTAELLAAVIDKGAAGMSSQEIARKIESAGATRAVSADDETITIGMHGLAADAGMLLDMMGKLVLKPDFLDMEVSRERSRILDRWRHVGDYGDATAALAFSRATMNMTVYGRCGLASGKEFSRLSRLDVADFYKAQFVPGNSLLMVVGRADKEKLKRKITEIFGSWSGGTPRHPDKRYTDPRLKSLRRGQVILVDRPGLNQAYLRVGFRAPLATSPDYYSLSVANALFGEYFNSRLNLIIRDKLGLTYSIHSGFVYRQEEAVFYVSAATKNESVGALLKKITEALYNLRTGPVSDDEVRTAKDYLIGSFPLGVATLESVASRWLSSTQLGLGDDFLGKYTARTALVTQKDVMQALSRHLKTNDAVVVIAGDAHEISKHLTAAGIKNIKLIAIADLM